MVAIAAGILDPAELLHRFGPWAFVAVLVIVFVECGLLFGLILPGDSLLFITGMFIASGWLAVPLWLAVSLIALSAIVGNLVGYWVGAKIGPPLFRRPDSRVFKQEYVAKTHEFFDKHGARAIVLARFVPIVRTLITATAGIAGMPFKRFAIYSALGGILWVASMTILGYYLGTIAFVSDNIEAITLGIVFISGIPVLLEFWRARKSG
jgi:membrane-associated protein